MIELANRMLAGISVPDTPLVDRAMEYARFKCEPYLFNHVVRSWLFATRLGQLQRVEHDAEVLAVGTLLHDITLNEAFGGPRRFEVEGADLARAFARNAGVDERRAQLIWDSVALNSTPSIGLYKEAEVALCTAGICLDVVGLQYGAVPLGEVTEIVATFPRLGMKQRMTRCFCHIARASPETTYDNFVRDFGERFVSGYKAPSAVDFVADAPSRIEHREFEPLFAAPKTPPRSRGGLGWAYFPLRLYSRQSAMVGAAPANVDQRPLCRRSGRGRQVRSLYGVARKRQRNTPGRSGASTREQSPFRSTEDEGPSFCRRRRRCYARPGMAANSASELT